MDSTFYSISNVKRKFSKPFNANSLSRGGDWKLDISLKQKEIADKLISGTITISNCPICDHHIHFPIVEIYSYPYHECQNCGHIFSKNPPGEDSIKRLYDETTEGTKSIQSEIYARKELFETRLNMISSPKAEFINDHIPQKGKWVDIGAGCGELVIAATRLGWETVGIESDAEEVNFATDLGAKMINSFIDDKNSKVFLEGAKVISLINVLEHILSPVRFINSISMNIEVNSYLAIEVPRHPSLSSLSNMTFPEYSARHIYAPDHLHIFTEKSIELLLLNNNFKPESIWLFGQDIYELFTSAFLKCQIRNRKLNNKLLSVVNELQSVIDSNCLSDTMLILAKKTE
jgi:2-polyprenyl-3-methyl-5-hydroxy-6-metoxy-1,4-benzoquinol methylase